MRKASKMLFFLMFIFTGTAPASQDLYQPDSVDFFRRTLETEHEFYRSLRTVSAPELSAQAEQIDLEHTIIQARLFMDSSGAIQATAGLCLVYSTLNPSPIELFLGGRGMEVHSVTGTGLTLQFVPN